MASNLKSTSEENLKWFRRMQEKAFATGGRRATEWLTTGLQQSAAQIKDTPGMEDFLRQFQVSALRNNTPFEIFIVGEGKFGKSTFINSLYGQEVAPTGRLPKTYCFHRFITLSKNEESERTFLITQELSEDVSWRHLWDRLRHCVKSIDNGFFKYDCDPQLAKDILSEEERRVGPGTYRTPIMEVEWHIKAPKALLPQMRLVDTQGLGQILASSVHKVHLEWEFQRADAVIWLVSAVKIRSAETEKFFDLFSRYSKPTILLLNQIDRIPAINQSRVIEESRNIYGKRGMQVVPFSAIKAYQFRTHDEIDRKTYEESGLSDLEIILHNKILSKQNLVKNRTTYVTFRERQREARRGLVLIRSAIQQNIRLHDEALAASIRNAEETNKFVSDEISQQKRRLYADLEARYLTIGYQDDQVIVQNKLRTSIIINSLTRLQEDIQQGLQVRFQSHLAELSKQKYRWPELAATGETREETFYPRVGDIDWTVFVKSISIHFDVPTSFWGRVSVVGLDLLGIFSSRAREAAERKRTEMSQEKRSKIKREMTDRVEAYMARTLNGYQDKVRLSASNVRQGIQEQVERLGGLANLHRQDKEISHKLTEYIQPSLFFDIPRQAMRNLGWPQSSKK